MLMQFLHRSFNANSAPLIDIEFAIEMTKWWTQKVQLNKQFNFSLQRNLNSLKLTCQQKSASSRALPYLEKHLSRDALAFVESQNIINHKEGKKIAKRGIIGGEKVRKQISSFRCHKLQKTLFRNQLYKFLISLPAPAIFVELSRHS